MFNLKLIVVLISAFIVLQSTSLFAGNWPAHSTTASADITQYLPGFQVGDSDQYSQSDYVEVDLTGTDPGTYSGSARSGVVVDVGGGGGAYARASSVSSSLFVYDGEAVLWGTIWVYAAAAAKSGGQPPDANYSGNAGATADAYIPDGTEIVVFGGDGQNLGNRISAGAGFSGAIPVDILTDHRSAAAIYVPEQSNVVPGALDAPIPGYASDDSNFMSDVQDIAGGQFSSTVSENPNSRFFVGISSSNVGVDDYMYFDPDYATGFQYEVLGTKVMSFVVPTALPGGDSTFFVDFDAFSVEISAGTGIHFTDYITAGVESFTLRGIKLSEQISPTDPGFISGMTFADATIVGLAITPITSSVPEPSASWLLGIGILYAGWHCRLVQRC